MEIQLHDHHINIEDGLGGLAEWLETSDYSSYFVLVDTNTEKFCLPLLTEIKTLKSLNVISILPGEVHKNLDTCSRIWQHLIDHNTDRNALFINLGGGVIGDMGGFAASCYKRGIDFINVPTTLLSQVDASIGGKLGIDFHYGKNLIGLFRFPKYVHVSTAFHKTLSGRQFTNGWAEIFKHALIRKPDQWERFSAIDDLSRVDMKGILYESIMVKKEIVDQDPLEKGLRKALNFGHTIGHAIEALSLESDTDPLLHGEAVATGMILESFISTEKCGLPDSQLQQISDTLRRHYPMRPVDSAAIDRIWQYAQMDKKNVKAEVRAALLRKIGDVELSVPIEKKDLVRALDYYRQFSKA